MNELEKAKSNLLKFKDYVVLFDKLFVQSIVHCILRTYVT